MAVPKIEFGQMKRSELQLSMHVPDNEGERIASSFFFPWGKVGFATPQLERFKQGTVSNSKADFSYDGTGTYIASTSVIQKIPRIIVKEQIKNRIRIRWTHNLMINTMKEVTGHANGVHFFTLSKTYLDFWIQVFRKPEFTDHIMVQIGNIPCLQEWSSTLPAFEASFDLPTPYSLDQALAFPVVLMNSFGLTFSLRNKIVDLLQMQELREVNGKTAWRDIPCKLNYLLGVPSNNLLDTPEVWGEVYHNSDFEKEWLLCKASYEMYYSDVVTIRSPNPEGFNSSATITMSVDYPAKAFMWAAENATAINNRYHSNYSTNSAEIGLAWNPIKTSTFSYTGGRKWEEMPSVAFDTIQPLRHFRSAPIDPGYNVFSVANDPLSVALDSGLVTSDTKPTLICHLADGPCVSSSSEDIEIPDEGDEDNNDSKFTLVACLIVSRKITIVRDVDNKGPSKILLDHVGPVSGTEP
jgi:hypothetical protein